MLILKNTRFLLCIISLLSILLVSCTGNMHENGNQKSTIQKSSQPASSTAKQPPITLTPVAHSQSSSHGVTMMLDKPQYLLHATIVATVTNNFSYPVYVSAYYTGCTPLQLQVQSNNNWLAWGRCPERSTSALALTPDSTRVFTLLPTLNSPNNLHVSHNPTWQSGTYRLLLRYSLQPDPDTTGGIPVTSTAFIITSTLFVNFFPHYIN